jgi:putative SOS response-associated peptidase YedK
MLCRRVFKLLTCHCFYEWRWLDEKGKAKISYHIAFKEQRIVSAAGLYSRWKDKSTNQYYYRYTILNTEANQKLEYVHNHGTRMPVFIPRKYEKDWLRKNLTKEDVLALCKPYSSDAMRAKQFLNLSQQKAQKQMWRKC